MRDSPSERVKKDLSSQVLERDQRSVDQENQYLEPAAFCRLSQSDPDGEAAVFAALAHESGRGSFHKCLSWARRLGADEKKELFTILVRHLKPYHSLPRAFEFVTVNFECVMSASCYAQFKRHRMGTMTVQDYDPALGITIPPSVEAVKLADRLLEIAGESEEAAKKIAETTPAAAPYILTNAHRRRVLFQANLRELNHFMRLRLDSHAQWDIRALAGRMAEQVQKKHGIETEFEDDGQPKPLGKDIRALLFRDVRELLFNVIKHAQAHKAIVSLERMEDHICVTVEDDGVGFDPVEVTAMAANRAEFGLFSIRERLEQMGGRIVIESEPGCGSKILMTAPLKNASARGNE